MWFTETPWPPIYICFAIAVLLAAAWWRNGRGVYLYGVIGLGVACIGIFVFEQWYITEPEEVEQAVYELAKAVEADDADRTVAFIAEEKFLLRFVVRAGMSRVRIEGGIRVTDVQAAYADEGESIVSKFRANGLAALKDGEAKQHAPTMWELKWKKIAGKWQITVIQRLNPMNEEKMGMLDAL